MDNKFVKGSFYLTAATFISKILGFIYIMPFTLLVGTSGYALYKYAYGPYTIMLYISTLGLPLAVSKYVAKYNSLGNYRAGKDLLKSGLLLMSLTGIAGFILLFFFAPYLAILVTSPDDSSGNQYSDVVYVIRMVSFALLVVPPMSLLRGFFQGNQSMGPSAISTVIEQIFRICFILLGSLCTIKFFKGTVTEAVGIGTLGAFVGGVSGLFVLVVIYLKRRRKYPGSQEIEKDFVKIPYRKMFNELIRYAVPFVLVGLAIPIYQNIDTFSINILFKSIGYSQGKAEEINSVVGLAQILVLIPVSLATSFGMSLIPAITSSYNLGHYEELLSKIKKTYRIIMFFTLPASVGLCLLSQKIYITVFGLQSNPVLGGEILKWYAPMAILFSLFTVSAAILQGIDKQKHAIVGMFIGVALKLTFNYILIIHIKDIGPVIATYIGYAFSVIYNIYYLKKYIMVSFMDFLKPLVPILILVFLMSIGIIIVNFIVNASVMSMFSKYWVNLIESIVSILVGLIIYLIISARLGILKIIINK
ncbi:putative polysaccharide biosynthesis protein [Neobacillus terrae]|uniref:putative polysaccharide biosynthesis protein n=1 Tax=Neobacillus terrae TaxID=3034837 RepID=UPI00140D456B|nr:polysaccharide biosynthesis protein [Neobacillus terrae]NHM31282.1 oligosaccharide flippase family protein [Neobacillus terrae]